MLEIKIKSKETACLFLSTVVFLTLLHCIALLFFFYSDSPKILDFVVWFDLDIERNIPSFYSSAAILVCSLLFFVVTYLEKKTGDHNQLYWIGLALIFLFLSLDEGFELHEGIGDVAEEYIHATGLLYFPWVVPYSFLAIVFTLLYLKFIIRLPKKTAGHFFLSGGVYFIGAVLFDMLGGKEAEVHGFDTAKYCILYTIEEFLEMIAVVGLIYAILSYIERQFGYMCITMQTKGKVKKG
ncbi:MAG: peptidase M48 Ste24p [Candidatus Electrothrix sp. AR4]|nr:peptidase M48 Ste24p [Candidatus Electrothrix sp. AR4]